MDGTLASIQLFGGTFCPRNWEYCYGQLVDISQNQALYSLLGTYYGGDGRTTLGLPDLRGRAAVGTGAGPGLTPRNLGSMYGSEHFTLNQAQMPKHTHVTTVSTDTQTSTIISKINTAVTVKAYDKDGDKDVPTGAYWAVGHALDGKNEHPLEGTYSSTSNVSMASDAVKLDVNSVIADSSSISTSTAELNISGNSQRVYFVQPSTTIPYILCMDGLYPARN